MQLRTEPLLAQGGDAIARVDGVVVFVSGAAPSELVEVELVQKNKRFMRARVLRVLEPSEHRVTPKCAHYEKCGGCALQHVSHEAQLKSKLESVLQTLARIGRVDLSRLQVAEPWAAAPYGYRSRARWSLTRHGRLGYREAKSSKIIAVDECPILVPALQRALLAPPKLRGRELSAVTDGEKVALSIEDKSTLLDDVPPFGKIALSPKVFSQANLEGNRAMLLHLDALLSQSGPFEHALELYSGSGNLSRVIARHAKTLHAVESHPAACALARKRAPKNTKIICAQANDAIDASSSYPLVVMNPPRAGLEDGLLKQLAATHPKVLIYVSCDAATFARDVARAAELGFELQQIRLFDLYPQTAHQEVMGRFQRV